MTMVRTSTLFRGNVSDAGLGKAVWYAPEEQLVIILYQDQSILEGFLQSVALPVFRESHVVNTMTSKGLISPAQNH